MNNKEKIELVSELTAYRQAYHFLLEALQASLMRFDKTSEPLLYEAMELKLSQIKGELLYFAPADLPSDQQTVANAAFHQTFDVLSSEILESVTNAFSNKG